MTPLYQNQTDALPARSRRAILLAAAGGTAAVVADSIARPRSAIAQAATLNRNEYDQPVTSTTGVRNSTNNEDVFSSNSSGLGKLILDKTVASATKVSWFVLG